jgi:hypothetical protein
MARRYCHDDAVKQLRSAAHHVFVASGDGIKSARVNRNHVIGHGASCSNKGSLCMFCVVLGFATGIVFSHVRTVHRLSGSMSGRMSDNGAFQQMCVHRTCLQVPVQHQPGRCQLRIRPFDWRFQVHKARHGHGTGSRQ